MRQEVECCGLNRIHDAVGISQLALPSLDLGNKTFIAHAGQHVDFPIFSSEVESLGLLGIGATSGSVVPG